MHIFSIYKQNESDFQFEQLKKIIISFNNKTISIESAINSFVELAFRQSNEPYSRSLACAMALNLKTGRYSHEIEERSNEFCRILESECKLNHDSRAKKLYPSVYREYQGIAEQYGYFMILPNENKKIPLQGQSKTVIYRPGKSGFFSVVENIINVQIYASITGKKVLIDLDGDWWVYKVKFEDIFDCFAYKKSFFQKIFFKKIKQDEARDWFFNLSPDFWHDYEEKKSEIYKSIYISLKKFLPITSSSLLENHNLKPDISIYIRRGDKIGLEDICLPDKDIINNIYNISGEFTNVYLLSDDTSWLKSNFSNLPQVSFDDDCSSGYFFGNESDTDHLDIIRKYLRMINSSQFSADTGSNLINAIVYTRLALGYLGVKTNHFFSTRQIPLI